MIFATKLSYKAISLDVEHKCSENLQVLTQATKFIQAVYGNMQYCYIWSCL